MSDAKEIIDGVREIIGDLQRGGDQQAASTHVRIETLGCGEVTVPVDHITLHMVGGTYRLLIRDDVDWREISGATYNYIQALLNIHV
jgi:hypothetical protein